MKAPGSAGGLLLSQTLAVLYLEQDGVGEPFERDATALNASLRLAPGVWIAAARIRIAAVRVGMAYCAIGFVVKQRPCRTGPAATETDAGHIVAL